MREGALDAAIVLPTVAADSHCRLSRRRTSTLFATLFFADVSGWVQMLVTTWILLHGRNPGFWVPALMVARAAPKLAASPFAGSLADRMDRLHLYRTSRVLAILPPLGLAVIAAHSIPWTAPGILAVAAFGSVLASLDQPARRGMLWDMGGPRRVFGVASINTAAFHSAASLAPALAVALVGTLGSTSALTAAVLITALSALCASHLTRGSIPRTPCAGATANHHPFGGFGYVLRTPRALLLLALTGAPGLFGRVLAIAIPVVAGSHAHASLAGTGALASAPGAGAFVAAVTLATLGEIPDKSRFALLCSVAFVVCMGLYPISNTYYGDAMLLALAGACSASFGTVIFSMLHLQVPDHLRGRVMAI